MATTDDILNLRSKHARELTLDDACRAVNVDPTDAPSRQPIWKLFQQLEGRGYGKAVVGRKGGATRFIWGAVVKAHDSVSPAEAWSAAAEAVAGIAVPAYKPPPPPIPFVPLPITKPLPSNFTQAEIDALLFLHKVAERGLTYAEAVYSSIGFGHELHHRLDRLAGRAEAAFHNATGIHPKDTTPEKVGDWKRK